MRPFSQSQAGILALMKLLTGPSPVSTILNHGQTSQSFLPYVLSRSPAQQSFAHVPVSGLCSESKNPSRPAANPPPAPARRCTLTDRAQVWLLQVYNY